MDLKNRIKRLESSSAIDEKQLFCDVLSGRVTLEKSSHAGCKSEFQKLLEQRAAYARKHGACKV